MNRLDRLGDGMCQGLSHDSRRNSSVFLSINRLAVVAACFDVITATGETTPSSVGRG
ncbi:MAG: hypothetical protein H7A46_15355 [Verrucomicrobiales bacterium]|nr:hypothetical protein [Verrucomicrobiales bacterium]